MEFVKDIPRLFGITRYLEFYLGIGVCILVPLLCVSFLMLVLTVWPYRKKLPQEWKYSLWGVAGCITACAGLLAVFIPTLFVKPSEESETISHVMFTGNALAIPGLLILLFSMLLDIKNVASPSLEGRNRNARFFIAYTPFLLAVTYVLIFRALDLY